MTVTFFNWLWAAWWYTLKAGCAQTKENVNHISVLKKSFQPPPFSGEDEVHVLGPALKVPYIPGIRVLPYHYL